MSVQKEHQMPYRVVMPASNSGRMNVLLRWWKSAVQNWQRRKMIAALEALDDRTLMDIGVHRLFGLGQDRRARFSRPGLEVLDRLALAPFSNGLRVDPKIPAQRRERSLRSLYCSSDGVRGRGASVTNLAHNASFHS